MFLDYALVFPLLQKIPVCEYVLQESLDTYMLLYPPHTPFSEYVYSPP